MSEEKSLEFSPSEAMEKVTEILMVWEKYLDIMRPFFDALSDKITAFCEVMNEHPEIFEAIDAMEGTGVMIDAINGFIEWVRIVKNFTMAEWTEDVDDRLCPVEPDVISQLIEEYVEFQQLPTYGQEHEQWETILRNSAPLRDVSKAVDVLLSRIEILEKELDIAENEADAAQALKQRLTAAVQQNTQLQARLEAMEMALPMLLFAVTGKVVSAGAGNELP